MKIITIAVMCLVVAEPAHSQELKKSEAASLQGHDEISEVEFFGNGDEATQMAKFH